MSNGDGYQIAGVPLQLNGLNEFILSIRVNNLVTEFQEFDEAGYSKVGWNHGASSPEKLLGDGEGTCSSEGKRKIEVIDVDNSYITVMEDKKTRFV